MPTRRALMASLFATFMALSVLADRGAPQQVLTGTVSEIEAGEWLSVVNETSDPMGPRVALRKTVYEGEPAAIKPGVRVTVWFRSIGERVPWPTECACSLTQRHTELRASSPQPDCDTTPQRTHRSPSLGDGGQT